MLHLEKNDLNNAFVRQKKKILNPLLLSSTYIPHYQHR